ncbi:NPHN protein, partial [Anseranas semipalmata]|nr:NPHN protein [Anseranas semipalmata]
GGEPLPEVSSHVFEDDDDPKLSSSEVTVRVSPQRGAHGQRLVCSATNEAGGDPAETGVTVSVLFPPEPPTIEGLESPQVRAGDTLRLVCVARGGNPPPSLHWDKVRGHWERWEHWGGALGALGQGAGGTESVGMGHWDTVWGHWECWEHW